MKTFSQFQEDAKGFKSEIGKKKSLNKQRKKEAKTRKEKRQDKIDALNANPKRWMNLESTQDPRTPKRYFVPRTVTKGKRIVDALSKGNNDSAVKMIKKELDMKIARKRPVRESMLRTAIEMEQQLFR